VARSLPPREPDYEAARQYALGWLERDLAPELTYHNLAHTRDDVLPAALRLAAASGVGEDETRLLEVAAAYHDIGFVAQYREHERAGAGIVTQVLPGFAFTPEQVSVVQGLILATRLPQRPRTPLEEILSDADLDSLGREDGLAKSEALRAEWVAQGAQMSQEAWYRHQLQFLREHVYFTEAARALRREGKRLNIVAMEELLAGISSPR
jgi:uncharacterized protein